MLKNLPQVLLDMIKALPLLVKALIFLVTTVPKKIIELIGMIKDFGSKARPIVFAIILTFFAVFFGIQFLFKYLTGLSGMPQIPLLVLSMYIVFDLVIGGSTQLKVMQGYLLKGLVLLFNNPIIKDIIKFNVDIDEKNPVKTTENVLMWILKNIPQVIFTFFAVAIGFKIGIKKTLSYINAV